MAQRVTYRRRNPYNTRSNKIRVVKTPGGVLHSQHVKKLVSRPKCGDCGVALPGIAAVRPRAYATLSKTSKSVSRVYGGSRCANCVKERIVRAFLIEEQKIVKKVVKEQTEASKKDASKSKSKKNTNKRR
ncbi:RPL34A (YER056C-A) and RPL34B (YIL052C) [Zygosaccharomyces parabailii]|uniref:BN860_01420g1_1 n=1 Tax=Zygosaccharomyces bailii (strain CLIB 213 / ATCC 58445 / CBS 680 / BCRC 21525 / NBRC 1098 / NCYC 1416 / NRRL Y-2227) TaxID=1333698 RepID=A0A8J2T4J5_ZYGB2|nr:RPL34A (YER056C-A) and RPL34B (YIL052C) [Zygosaccharomyces parabailii]CDF88062.1 BN860_01420g1_1 [Zygosaccharomyces bailii CLIB 213]SJM87370.1 probable 60S ribosomal protein L34-B [Zygosaccharomyces bailii]